MGVPILLTLRLHIHRDHPTNSKQASTRSEQLVHTLAVFHIRPESNLQGDNKSACGKRECCRLVSQKRAEHSNESGHNTKGSRKTAELPSGDSTVRRGGNGRPDGDGQSVESDECKELDSKRICRLENWRNRKPRSIRHPSTHFGRARTHFDKARTHFDKESGRNIPVLRQGLRHLRWHLAMQYELF